MSRCPFTPWKGYDLPCPSVQAYDIDAGLVRTVFADGTVRQRRRRPRGRRLYALTWQVEMDALQTLELFLAAYGSNWFQMPGPSGADIRLRVIDAARYLAQSNAAVEVSVTAESNADS